MIILFLYVYPWGVLQIDSDGLFYGATAWSWDGTVLYDQAGENVEEVLVEFSLSYL